MYTDCNLECVQENGTDSMTDDLNSLNFSYKFFKNVYLYAIYSKTTI